MNVFTTALKKMVTVKGSHGDGVTFTGCNFGKFDVNVCELHYCFSFTYPFKQGTTHNPL